jgi:hypothetical protein
MKFQVLNNEQIGFYDDSGNLQAIIKPSGSNLIIDPVAGGNIELGQNNVVNDVEIGITSTPSNLTFLGGGTISANGNTLYLGDSAAGDNVIIDGVQVVTSYFSTGSLTLTENLSATNVSASMGLSVGGDANIAGNANITGNTNIVGILTAGTYSGIDSGSWSGVYTGNASISGGLQITGSTSTTGGYALRVADFSRSNMLLVENNGVISIRNVGGLVIGTSIANANGVKGNFEFNSGLLSGGEYDSTLQIRANGNPGGFGLNGGLYLRKTAYQAKIGSADYDPLIFASGMSPSGNGTTRGGYSYNGNWAFGEAPTETPVANFIVNGTSQFKNNLTITGSTIIQGSLTINSNQINFASLPTSNPNVAGRLFQTSSAAIGAAAGFQVVCISQG